MNHAMYINKPIRLLASNLEEHSIGLYCVISDGEQYSLKEAMEDTYLRRKIISNIVSHDNWSFSIYCKSNC